jgi:hypothetical protein
MYCFFQHFIADSISGLLVPLHIQKCMNDLDFEKGQNHCTLMSTNWDMDTRTRVWTWTWTLVIDIHVALHCR